MTTQAVPIGSVEGLKHVMAARTQQAGHNLKLRLRIYHVPSNTAQPSVAHVAELEGTIPATDASAPTLDHWQTHGVQNKGTGRLLLDIFMRCLVDSGFKYCDAFAGGTTTSEEFYKIYNTYYSVGFRGSEPIGKKTTKAKLHLRLTDYHTSISLAAGIVQGPSSVSGQVLVHMPINGQTISVPSTRAHAKEDRVKIERHVTATGLHYNIYEGRPEFSGRGKQLLGKFIGSSSRT